MKVLLTGVTGNLGRAVARDLVERRMTAVPVVRSDTDLSGISTQMEPPVMADLVSGKMEIARDVDSIVHVAGDVRFKQSGNNTAMMRTIVRLAQQMRIPVYYVSTAYVTEGEQTGRFNNSYESDKHEAEGLLTSANVPCAVIRPSVIVGDTVTGEIARISGFYSIVQALLVAVSRAKRNGRAVRFPQPTGLSDLVPVDAVARAIGALVENSARGVFYATNPSPPRAADVLESVVHHYGLGTHVHVLPSEEIKAQSLTDEEKELHRLLDHYMPYWSQAGAFPMSCLGRNYVDRHYLEMILSYADEKLYERAN